MVSFKMEAWSHGLYLIECGLFGFPNLPLYTLRNFVWSLVLQITQEAIFERVLPDY